MASKLAQLLTDQQLDPRRVLAASRVLEHARAEQRLARSLKAKQAKSKGKKKKDEGDAKASEDEAQAPKEKRYIRPVSKPTFDAAMAGKPIAPRAKTKLLRAINHLLTQKKKDPVDLRAAF